MISRYLISVLHTFAVTFNQFNLLNEVWVHLTNSEDLSLGKLWVSCNLKWKWSILALLNRTSCLKISSTLAATFTSECLSCNAVVVWLVQPSVILARIKESQADVYLCEKTSNLQAYNNLLYKWAKHTLLRVQVSVGTAEGQKSPGSDPGGAFCR